MLYSFVDVLLRILPRIYGHLGIRGQASDLHRDLVGMRWYVVGGYQQRRLDGTHEIASNGVNEVRAVCVHVGEEILDHVHADFWATLA